MRCASLSGAAAGRRDRCAGLDGRPGAHACRARTARIDAGDIFIEALISAAVVSLIMVAMFRVVTDAAAHVHMTEQRRTALLIAKSELAAVGSTIPVVEGQTSGSSGDMIWTVDISSYSDDTGASAVGALWAVDVSVRERSQRRALISLRTLRIGPEA